MSYPMQPSIRQIAALAAAIDCGSIRRAAQRLGLTQPALSAQIAALEAELGMPLLDRTSSGVVPTAEGRAVDAIGRRVLDGVREIADRGRSVMGGEERPLQVDLGVSVSVGPYLLPPAFPELQRRAPGLRLSVREGSTDRLAEELRAGMHDLVLTQLPIPVDGVGWTEIGVERLLLLMAAEHPLAALEAVPPEKLAGQRFLTLGPGFVLTRTTERLAADCGAQVLRGYDGNSMDALRLMCRMGQEIALVPEIYARSEVRPDRGVVTRPLARRRLDRVLAVAWRETQGEPALATLLAGCLSAVLRAEVASRDQP